MNPDRSRVVGMIVGGAVGDALGAPVEFMSLEQIHAKYGDAGIQEFDEAYGVVGAITDDTQMSLYTAEIMIRCIIRFSSRGICSEIFVGRNGYSRWLNTQGESNGIPSEYLVPGYIDRIEGLRHRRAPGLTCLSALKALGEGEPRANDSKGCGAVMRMAPVGLVGSRDFAFRAGASLGQITHGHVFGWGTAALLAAISWGLIRGESLSESIERIEIPSDNPSELLELRTALQRACSHGEALKGRATPKDVAAYGEGWVGEEALAIAVFCAAAASDFESGVRLAVNIGGDSDSTGAITGNLLGAMLGLDSIPIRWRSGVELSKEIHEIADDLYTAFNALPTDSYGEATTEWWERYPGC